MGGVRCLGGVVVTARVSKVGSGAAVTFVDVKPEESRVGGRQSLDGRLHQNAAPPLIKSHLSAQVGVGVRAADDRYGVG